MNVQAILDEKMKELGHSDPGLSALSGKILKDKSGKAIIPLTGTNYLNRASRKFNGNKR